MSLIHINESTIFQVPCNDLILHHGIGDAYNDGYIIKDVVVSRRAIIVPFLPLCSLALK